MQLVRCVSFAAKCPNSLRAFRKVYRRTAVNRSGKTRTVPLAAENTTNSERYNRDQHYVVGPSSVATMLAKVVICTEYTRRHPAWTAPPSSLGTATEAN